MGDADASPTDCFCAHGESAAPLFEDEVAAEVFFAYVGVVGEVLGCAFLEDGAFVEEVGAVGDMECFADVVVGDEDADVAFLEFEDDVLDVLHGDGVDTGEGLVEEEEHGVVGEGACYLGATAFATGELYAFALADVLEVEFVEEGLEFFFALVFVEVLAEFEDGHDVVGDGHLAEDGGFLCEVSDAHLSAAVHGVACELDGHFHVGGNAFGEDAALDAVLEEEGMAVGSSLYGLAFLRGEVDFAGEGFDDAHDHVKGGGLAGTVGAEEADDFALGDFDGGTLDDGAGAVFLDYVVGVEFHGFFICG